MNNKIDGVMNCYNVIAKEYAKRYYDELDNKPFDRMILKYFADLIDEGGFICDVGCGPGEIASYVNKFRKNVSGIDISKEMIKEAKIRNKNVHYKVGNMFDLKIKSGSYDGIIAFYAIVNYDIKDVEIFINEICRIIKDGGYLLISFHVGNEILYVNEFLKKNNSIKFYFFDQDEIIRIIKQAGFNIKDAFIRYPYKGIEYESKRAYIIAEKPV